MRLLQGDCRELLPGIIKETERPVIVTDPPFNVGYHYDTYGDRMDETEYYGMLADMLRLAPAVVIHYPEALHRLSITAGRAPERVVSWVYPSNTRRQHRDIAFYGVTPDFTRVRQPYRNPGDMRVRELARRTGGAALYDWWEVDQVKNVSREKTAHPCQMPVEVMERVVGVLPDGVTVIDPFMGSGTTGVACVRHGVDFIGIELDPAYHRIAERRIGEESCLIGS
jgi:site-specific DNA-methyltransferase (adenine-specific)